MSCTTAEMSLLLEYIERRVYDKAIQLGMPKEKARQIVIEVELIKQAILEKGMTKIIRELGI